MDRAYRQDQGIEYGSWMGITAIPVNTPVFPWSLPYFTPISCTSPVVLFLPRNSRNLYGPNLVIWIITSLFYSKVVQWPDNVWNASPHTIYTIHISNHSCPQTGNLQPSCAVDLCARSRRGKLNLASVVEMEGEESGGAPAKKTKSWCKLNNRKM